MELPVLDKFCFVFDLKTGCITMGIFNSIITFILALLLVSFAMDIKTAAEMATGSRRFDDDVGMSSVVYTLVILMAVLLFIKFLLDLLFVFAVTKEKRGMMTKYCIFWIIFLVLFSIGFLKTLFHMDAGHVIAQMLFLAENFYYIVVIRSYLMFLHEDSVL